MNTFGLTDKLNIERGSECVKVVNSVRKERPTCASTGTPLAPSVTYWQKLKTLRPHTIPLERAGRISKKTQDPSNVILGLTGRPKYEY